jgi:hypothetical protein
LGVRRAKNDYPSIAQAISAVADNAIGTAVTIAVAASLALIVAFGVAVYGYQPKPPEQSPSKVVLFQFGK